jgi:Ca2+:H+ antiporter
MGTILKQEKFLLLAVIATCFAYPFEHQLLGHGHTVALIAGIALVGFIICASLRVAHHAELLAEKVGDPYGTMILTLSAVLVEVVILAIMMSNEPSPTLVRDTIYSAVMLDINGILGLAALMGGLKHGEQSYNDDSARSYSVMILTAMAVSMVVPEFIPEGKWKLYSAFTIGAMILLYALFLRMQVGPHSYFFSYSYPDKKRRKDQAEQPHEEVNLTRSIATLVFGVVVMSKAVDLGLEGSGAPPVMTAILVAAISAAPEILTALRAALANRMQSVVNIALGASLSTVILTVPVMEAMALYSGQAFQMAMTPVQTVMIFVTLLVCAINLNDGETNAIEGMTHFVLFATFIMLSLMGL